jgi:hypothetical protein
MWSILALLRPDKGGGKAMGRMAQASQRTKVQARRDLDRKEYAREDHTTGADTTRFQCVNV